MIGFDADLAAKWYCCLASIEFEMLRAVSDAQTGIQPFLLPGVYEAFWLTYGQNAGGARRDAFQAIFGVTEGQFQPPDGDPFTVWFLDLTFWTPLWLWRLANPDPCPEDCELRTFNALT
jgi:hypothetical protein